MKIPKTFYIRFWLKSSAMAAATGFLVGLLFIRGLIPFHLLSLAAPIVALCVYQYAVYRYFWGSRRGHFEYAYREWLLRKSMDLLVIKNIGLRNYIRLYLDELSTFGSVREDIYKTLLKKDEINQEDDHMFSLYVRIAESALKESSFDREAEYLRKAISIRPSDLVANYRLGNSLERVGDGPGAIRSYEAAIRDTSATGKELNEFILDQIRRIEMKGPAKRPPMLGFSYMSW